MVPRWLAGAFASAVIFNSALAFVTYREHQNQLDLALHDVRMHASALAQAVEMELDRADRTLSGVADALAERARGDNKLLHHLLLRRHALSPFLHSMFVIGVDGGLLTSSRVVAPPRSTHHDRDYFRAFSEMGQDGVFIGRPSASDEDGQRILPMAHAVKDKYDRMEMVVVGGISLRALETLEGMVNDDGAKRIAILLSDGTPLVCLRVPSCDGTAVWPFFAELQGVAGGSMKMAFMGEQAGPGAYKRGGRYGITAVVAMDQDAAVLYWRQSLPYAVAISAGGTLFIALATLAIVRQIRRRNQAMAALAVANATLEAKVAERTEDLRAGEARLRGFIQAAGDAVVVIGENSLIEEFNPAAARMFGFPPDAVLGRHVAMLMAEEELPRHEERMFLARRVGAGALDWRREMLGRRSDGTIFTVEVTVGTHVVEDRKVLVGVMRDITERKAEEDTLRRMANYDALTGVFNRRRFLEEGERLQALSHRSGRSLAVVMADADHFKSVNDRFGHDVGDQVLKALAATLSGGLRATDVLGRMGGEEFAVILPDAELDGAQELASRLLDAVRRQRLEVDGQILAFTMSMGIAAGREETLAELLKRADEALYRAKGEGRDRVVAGKAP